MDEIRTRMASPIPTITFSPMAVDGIADNLVKLRAKAVSELVPIEYTPSAKLGITNLSRIIVLIFTLIGTIKDYIGVKGFWSFAWKSITNFSNIMLLINTVKEISTSLPEAIKESQDLDKNEWYTLGVLIMKGLANILNLQYVQEQKNG